MNLDLAEMNPVMKRVGPSIGILVGVLVVIGGLGYWLVSESERLRDRNAQLISENNRKVSAIRELRGDTSFVREQLSIYRKIEARGFLTPKSQSDAAALLTELANAERLNELTYEFGEPVAVEVPTRRDIDARLLSTPIELQISALSDAHVFAFLDAFAVGLPGHVSVRQMELDRVSFSVESAVERIESQWRRIGDDPARRPERPAFVNAQIILDWTTMQIVTEGRGS